MSSWLLLILTWLNWCSKRVWCRQTVLVVVTHSALTHIVVDYSIEPFPHAVRHPDENWNDCVWPAAVAIPWTFDCPPLVRDWKRESLLWPDAYYSMHLYQVRCVSGSGMRRTETKDWKINFRGWDLDTGDWEACFRQIKIDERYVWHATKHFTNRTKDQSKNTSSN